MGLRKIIRNFKLWFCRKTGVQPPNSVYVVWLCKNGSAKEIARAVKYGANINAMFDENISGLMFAIFAKRDIQIIRTILELGANVNLQGKSGETALMIAVSKGCGADIINMLLDFGADVSLKNTDGFTALDFAKEFKNTEAEKILVHVSIN